jgi:hypothetical protein
MVQSRPAPPTIPATPTRLTLPPLPIETPPPLPPPTPTSTRNPYSSSSTHVLVVVHELDHGNRHCETGDTILSVEAGHQPMNVDETKDSTAELTGLRSMSVDGMEDRRTPSCRELSGKTHGMQQKVVADGDSQMLPTPVSDTMHTTNALSLYRFPVAGSGMDSSPLPTHRSMQPGTGPAASVWSSQSKEISRRKQQRPCALRHGQGSGRSRQILQVRHQRSGTQCRLPLAERLLKLHRNASGTDRLAGCSKSRPLSSLHSSRRVAS